MKQILLIDREFGAGGSAIGAQLAHRLKWDLFDHALSEEIARLAKIPVHVCKKHEERADPLLQRLVNIIWRGSIGHHLPSPDMAVLDTDRLVSLLEKVILEAAEKKPCVIVGRGAPYFLRNRTDIFSVFLYAPRDLKYHRIRERVGHETEALELLDTMDEDRRNFVKKYFGHEWPKRELFHAMLNTSMGDDNTVDTILGLLEDANRKEGAKIE